VSFFRLSCALFRHVFMQAQAHFMHIFFVELSFMHYEFG